MLFKWYSADFGGHKEDVLTWIHENMADSNEKRRRLSELLRADTPDYVVKYIKYDWGHNDEAKNKKKK